MLIDDECAGEKKKPLISLTNMNVEFLQTYIYDFFFFVCPLFEMNWKWQRRYSMQPCRTFFRAPCTHYNVCKAQMFQPSISQYSHTRKNIKTEDVSQNVVSFKHNHNL